MKTRFLTYILLLCAVLVSCDRTDPRLRDIDSIMESAPETALEQLQQIQPSALSEDDYAYYALLYSQGLDKCRIFVTSDSLISVAYKKYAAQPSGNLKMRTLFYSAMVFFNKSDFKSSMKDAVAAYDIAKESEDSYWIAKTAELISDILWYVYNYSQAEIYEHEAVENYLLAGRIDNHRYALCDLASIYMNENKMNEGIMLIDSLYMVVTNEMPVDSALLDYMASARASALLEKDELSLLESVLKSQENSVEDAEDRVNLSIMNSILYNQNGETEDAQAFLSDAYQAAENEKQRLRIMYQDFRQSLSTEQYKSAAILADSLILVQTSVVGELLKESVTAEQGDYYSEKAKYQQRLAELRLYALVALAIVSLIITILIIRNYRLNARAKKAEFEANLSSLMIFKVRAEQVGNENQRLAEELESLFRNKWDTLNMLCGEYFDKGEFENAGSMILKKIEKEVGRLRSKGSLKDIETAVDKYMGNIMSMLREECAFLKEDDFVLLSLIFAGFSSRTVCLMMDLKYKQFYQRKSRLAKRIAESTAPHKELFLSKLR